MDGCQPDYRASLCVLASGSAGNCTVLRIRTSRGARIIMIDAGLSPRRTRRLLEPLGLGMDDLDGVLLTHLDRDHWHMGWLKALPEKVPVWAHKRHVRRGRLQEVLPTSARGFEERFSLEGCAWEAPLHITAALASHDELGVASFRIEVTERDGGSLRTAALGFATDVGRMRDHLVEHLRGVDVLAIESNYCPLMQAASSRPWFLKRRITGGSGHLSNEEALEAVQVIGPRSHVVLLHLSRECNDPQLVAGMHHGAPYACTITNQFEPTGWVPLCASLGRPAGEVTTMKPSQLPLFGGPAPATDVVQDGGGVCPEGS